MTAGGVCRLAVVASHPIQYFTPLYRRLAARPGIDLEVMFCRPFGVRPQYDRQFAREIEWDTDQLSGYRHRFLWNISPILDTFNPLHAINPGAFFRLLTGYDALWVNGYMYPSNWLAASAGKLRGTKLLMRSDLRIYGRRVHRWYDGIRDAVVRGWIRASDGLLYVGQANRDAYEQYGATPSKLFFTPHSIDVERIEETKNRLDSAGKKRLRRKWGLPEDEILILSVGKLTARKHPEAIVELAKRLSKVSTAHVVFAGSGPLESALRQEVARHSLRNVTFLGFINQTAIPEIYALGDLFIMAPESEPWGLALNEAMAAGLAPIVSNEVGAVPDLITHGVTGFAFPFGDWDEMYRHTMTVSADEELRARIGAAARERVRRYSFDAAVQGIVECLTALGVYSRPVAHVAEPEYVRH